MRNLCRLALLGIVAGLLTSCEDGGGFSLGDVNFIHENVSGWAETATHNVTDISTETVWLDSDKKDAWPTMQGVNASCWVIFKVNGAWYASTFDYMRPGQVSKGIDDPAIQTHEFRWRPSHGEEIGFMVSGLARDARRNVSVRSNVVFVTFP